MKSALVAIDPLHLKEKPFEAFCETVRLLQQKRVFSRTLVRSVIHSAQYSLPYSFYRERVDELSSETRRKLVDACKGKFKFANAKVIRSNSHVNDQLVELLSKEGARQRADLVVVNSQDRAGLPYWLLGSLSETAALSAKLPVLVIKNAVRARQLKASSDIVVAIDVSTLPSARELKWIAGLAKAMRSRVHLVYVQPERIPIIEKLQRRVKAANAIDSLMQVESSLQHSGISTTSTIKKEGRSIPHTLVKFAESKSALLTIVTTVKRAKLRKLLIGSTARNILALSKRPVLSLRLV